MDGWHLQLTKFFCFFLFTERRFFYCLNLLISLTITPEPHPGNAMFGFRRSRKLQPSAGLEGRAARETDRWFADADRQFRAFVGAAGQARDRGEFEAAAAGYRQALALDRTHVGGWAELAYVLQEMADWCGAEVALRTAMALGLRGGAAALAFLVEKGGGVYARAWTDQVEAYWRNGGDNRFDVPPTSRDVADAIELLCDRGEPDPAEIRELMRASPTRRALIARLLRGEEFRRYHADLLRLIAETGWGG